jgi:hypothetical protein
MNTFEKILAGVVFVLAVAIIMMHNKNLMSSGGVAPSSADTAGNLNNLDNVVIGDSATPSPVGIAYLTANVAYQYPQPLAQFLPAVSVANATAAPNMDGTAPGPGCSMGICS